ncbi:putative T7SS-secreted protein [Streptomyces sp. NPDC048331]|uniref:putative T7SS-secreted protein n=1 Tax=Streptomyces sp. NPDC048331 TaxID=3365534 RepID=UPI00371C39F7
MGGLIDKGLDKIDEKVDSAKKVIGHGVDRATDEIGGALDRAGAHGWADKVEDFGDNAASRLGATVREQQLGESEQADELIHGRSSTLRESAKHFADFQAAFDRVGQGMKALDSDRWKGQAADAFRAKFAMHPTDWLRASDACEAASVALARYAETVEWAQKQAREAIELHKAAMKASKEAHDAHLKNKDAYEAAAKAGHDPGPVPVEGADPGDAARTRAKEILDEARRQRDEAATTAERALKAAMEHAPAEPPATDRLLADIVDYAGSESVELSHVVGGALKGTAGTLNFARGLNPLDVYNLTHPADFHQNLSMTLAGLVSTASHPERIPGPMIDSYMADPDEFKGRLLPDLIGSKGLPTIRSGMRFAEDAAESAARREAARVGEHAEPSGTSAGPPDERGLLMRQDDDFYSELNSRGQRKSHLNENGDLVPANPDGQASIVDHVVGRDPKKSDSPYTSLSSDGADAKDFGNGKIKIDLPRLEQDIASGRVQGVSVHSPEDVQSAIQASANEIAGRHVDLTVPPDSTRPAIEEAARELGLSNTKTKRIAQRMVDMMNTRRDQEWLIKGIVPSDYISGPQ